MAEPASTADLAAATAQVRDSLDAGNYLLACDQASRASQSGLQSRELEYLGLLALANAGSTQLALTRLRSLHLTQSELDEDWLALEGRLLKDLAAGAADPAAVYREAGLAYEAAYERTGGTFSAINAATTLLLGDRPDRSAALAREVRAQVLLTTPHSERGRYYQCVTEAEAALLLGDTARAAAALRGTEGLLRSNLNVRSRTAHQLRLICRRLGLDESLLSALTLAPVVHVFGAAPDARPAPEASFVYAALTEPQTLASIEPYLQRGTPVHAVLPLPQPALVEHWQQRHGGEAAARLRQALVQMQERSEVRGFLDDEDCARQRYVGKLALGLSRLAAKRLGCRWQTVGAPPSSACGPDLPGRSFVGTVFADFAGYTRLTEAEMRRFHERFLGAIAERLEPHRAQILLKHSWGDAVHLVTGDAASSARIAIDLQQAVERARVGQSGGLASLHLRLGAHYGVAHSDFDPIDGIPTFYGSQISFASRIEPITPPGMMFVTEAFAAQVTLDAPEEFLLEYAGELALAKRTGDYRLFSLRAAQRRG